MTLCVLPPQLHSRPLPANELRDVTHTRIVIHNDGGNLPTAITWAVLRMRRLSYHYFISRDGSITQFVPLSHIAYHAGPTKYEGMKRWNEFSVGIALQGVDTKGYTDAQYESLRYVIRMINIQYPDSREHKIVRHSDIASPRGRKTDPGKHFDMERITNDTSAEFCRQD